MKINSKKLRGLRSLAGIALLSLGLGFIAPAHADSLYIGDQSDNTVKRFDAVTGEYQGEFIKKGNSPIKGSRGLIFNGDGDLLVSNQNVNTDKYGDILKHDGTTGKFLGALVFHNDQNAPFSPRGIVLNDDVLFVADIVGKGNDVPPGRLLAYTKNGGFIADLTPDPVTEFPGAAFPTAEFHPRSVVVGPDDLLYVSVVHDLDPKSTNFNPANVIAGWILRFKLDGSFFDVFNSNEGTGCAALLHRPEGLVFGPDGNLYVTAFRRGIADHGDINEPEDTDKILIFDRGTKQCVDKIDLDQPTKPQVTYVPPRPRAFAQAILFGPDGFLFVPISGNGPNTGPDTGAVRRYNVADKTFENFVPPPSQGGPLGEGWYLTFGNTNPSTLDYE